MALKSQVGVPLKYQEITLSSVLQVLKSMGVNLKDARVETEKIIGRGSGFVAVEIPFTPRAKRVLELSLEEARQLGKPATLICLALITSKLKTTSLSFLCFLFTEEVPDKVSEQGTTILEQSMFFLDCFGKERVLLQGCLKLWEPTHKRFALRFAAYL